MSHRFADANWDPVFYGTIAKSLIAETAVGITTQIPHMRLCAIDALNLRQAMVERHQETCASAIGDTPKKALAANLVL